MDPITHFSAGVIIGSRFSNEPVLPLFCGCLSVVNDLDFVFKWINHKNLYFLHHKAFHSIYIMLFLSLLASVPVSLLFGLNFSSAVILCLMLFLSHIILDIFVAGGDMTILFPFSMKLFSFPIFPGITPYIKSAKCEKKSPVTCGICQTEVFLRSLFRLSIVAISVAVMIRRDLIWLIFIPLLIIFVKASSYMILRRYIKKRYSSSPHIIPVSSFPSVWNAVFSAGSKLIVKKLGIRNLHVHETSTKEFLNNDIIDEYKTSLNCDKNISSFLESHPVLYAVSNSVEEGTMLTVFDPRFFFNDKNQYFSYRILLDSSGRIKNAEFREKWR